VSSKILIALFFALLVSFTEASSEGIHPMALNQYSIAGFTRPCCSFGLDYLGEKFHISGVTDPKQLGPHHFARFGKMKDTVGMVYTCRAGFVDVSHLRDNADWSAHVYFNLKKWLGSGKEILARNEGGFKKRAVYFPKLTPEDLSLLTEDDLALIATSIGFNMALLHEIPTSFNFPVSVPSAVFTNEKSSAFSVEDAYSNLLGNIIGTQAARSSLPYNQAMTEIINSTITELGSQAKPQTLETYDISKNDWWVAGLQSNLNNFL